MFGTFGGALEARQIDASAGKLSAEVTGEVEQEEGILVIRRIHVSMRLVASAYRVRAAFAGLFHKGGKNAGVHARASRE
jgi:hypothetical protein